MIRLIAYILLSLSIIPCIAGATGAVAYLAHTAGYWQVWTMQPDGSHQTQISKSEYDKSHISWYPDGNHILVNGNQGELNKLNIETGKEAPIELPIKGTVDAVVSPNGQYIAFSLSVAGSVDNNHIWLVNANGQNLVKLTKMDGLQHEPVWSPNGQWIYFLSGRGGQAHDIWRVAVESRQTEQLTAGQLYNFDLAIAQQDKIAFSSNRSGNYEIWVRGKGKEKQITHNDAMDSRPSWSPDTKKIMYESTKGGRMNIWSLDIEQGNPVQLTRNAIGARYPVWWQGEIGDGS